MSTALVRTDHPMPYDDSRETVRDVLAHFTDDDDRFLVELLQSQLNRTSDAAMQTRIDAHAAAPTPATRAALDAEIERALAYLGSSDVAYVLREASGQTPGVSLDEVVDDAAKALGIAIPRRAMSFRRRVEAVAEAHAAKTLAGMTPEAQQRFLEDAGVERQQAARFVKTAAGVFAFPALVAAFEALVVERLLRGVVFGTIAKLVGRRISGALFGALLARTPWWLRAIGPASLALSVGWTLVDLAGPALRKTVPAVLYLGLVSHRARLASGEGEDPHDATARV